jgi:hypothetical protein
MKLLPLLLLAFVLSLGVACSEAEPPPPTRVPPTRVPIAVPTATLTAPQATSTVAARATAHAAWDATATVVASQEAATAVAVATAQAKYAPTATAIAYATAYAQYEKDLKVYNEARVQETAIAATAKDKAQESGKPLVIRELDYWEETNPLIEFAILQGGTPFGKVIRQVQPGLMSGNQKDWKTLIAAVEIALPVYQRALNDWLEIQPPSAGKSPALHRAYANAWAKRIESFQAMSVGWSNGDDDLVLSGYNSMGAAGQLGQRAESLRAEFNTYLYEQCNKHKYKECN